MPEFQAFQRYSHPLHVSRHAILRYQQRVLERPLPDCHKPTYQERLEVEPLIRERLAICRSFTPDEALAFERASVPGGAIEKARKRYLFDGSTLFIIEDQELVTVLTVDMLSPREMDILRMRGRGRFASTPHSHRPLAPIEFCRLPAADWEPYVTPWLQRYSRTPTEQLHVFISPHIEAALLPDHLRSRTLEPLPPRTKEALPLWRDLFRARASNEHFLALCSTQSELVTVLVAALQDPNVPLRRYERELQPLLVYAVHPDRPVSERLQSFFLKRD
jgi:hypothetical protein